MAYEATSRVQGLKYVYTENYSTSPHLVGGGVGVVPLPLCNSQQSVHQPLPYLPV